MTKVGYARTSTADQNAELQRDALERDGCERILVETISGASRSREVLDGVVAGMSPGDTLVVWKLDRLGRSLRGLIETVQTLAERQVMFRSITEQIDTSTSGGRLVFHIFAALAEFERDLIRERTNAGLAAARTRGRKGGRPQVLTQSRMSRARDLIASGLTVREAAARIRISKSVLYARLAEEDEP